MGKGFRIAQEKEEIAQDIIECVLALLECSDEELWYIDETSDFEFYERYGVRNAKSSRKKIPIYKIWKSCGQKGC